MIDWKFANKLRPHNRNETFKHFIAKAIAFKILFNAGYLVYSEHDVTKGDLNKSNNKTRVADVIAYDGHNTSEPTLSIVVEVETKPTKKHNKELMKFYEDRTLYIIDLRKISEDIVEMEKQIKHILGL